MRKQHGFKRKALVTAVGAATLLSGQAVLAQGQPTLEEIVVTATAREQSMQDIPYNISAMSGSQIEDLQITDQAELLRAMSGVSVVDRGYRNSGTVNSIIIRGLNVDNGQNGDIALNAVPTVSTYIDNTPIFANFVLKDLERVEVLRGPQGTLYGSGSLGGTVRYITRKPSTESVEGRLSASYSQSEGSDGDNKTLDGTLNIPMGDRFAIRGTLGRIDNDGIIDYVNAYRLDQAGDPMIDAGGGECISPSEASDDQVLKNNACFRNQKDADDVKIDFGRIALLWDATDNLDFLLSYHTQEDDIGARRATTLGNNNQPANSDLYFEYDDFESGQVLLEPSTREVDLFSLDVQWDLGFATLTSNTSTYEHEGYGESDNGGLWVSGGEVDPDNSNDWVNAWYTGWARPAQRAERGYKDEALVQELRLVSNESIGGFDWLVGAFYQDQEQTVYQNSYNPGMNEFNKACRSSGGGDPTMVDPVCANFWPRWYEELSERDLEYRRDVDFEELAIYGELTYNFSDTVRLTGGLRWFDNETTNNTIMGFPLVEGWTSSVVPESKNKDDDILVKMNLSWDLSDATMLYGTYSEGYRRGGANAVPSADNSDPFGEANAAAIRSFDSDSVQNYEIGIKGGTGRLTYSASAFWVDWQDPQLNSVTAGFGFYIADNGDEASTKGVELEVNGLVTDNLHYRLGYAYVKAELEKDFLSSQTGGLVAPDGSSLPGTPEHVFSGALDQTWQLGSATELVGRFNAYYQSESENFINQGSLLNETFDSFWLLNASLALVMDNWDVTLWGKNLSDEDGVTGAFASSSWSYDSGVFEGWYGNGNRQMITQPRTLGLTASYNF